ncbi:MAG: prepilin peptidase [Chloroflexi bacterium]|nr:prepilin peptidase [Chloroflexota bacterium]
MATAEFIILIGLLGLAVGSFLNVCIDRLPKGLSIVALPSHCERCQHRLKPLDLVPVLSYLWLRGRCRYCKVAIPWRIPLGEAVTGLLFAYVAFRYEVTLETVVVLGFVGVLIVVFFIDLEHSLILDRVMYPAVAAALLVVPVGPLGQGQDALHAYIDAFLGIAIGGGTLAMIYFGALRMLGQDAFGWGDVKLGVFLGAILGVTQTLVALPLSFISGGLLGLTLLILKVRGRKDAIPFGPFLAVAGLVSLFWGQTIFNWYRGIFPN